MISTVEVNSPGNRLTVQDLGRRGSQRFGVSVSGVLDISAAVTANRLVGNPANSAMVEATFGGVSLSFNSETRIAITGAEVNVDVDGFQMPIWETLILPAETVLTLSIPSTGLYSYISVAGGIDSPVVLGSRSTHVASGIGGHEGRTLAAGDILRIGEEIDVHERPRAGTTASDGIVPGSNDHERPIRVTSHLNSMSSMTTRSQLFRIDIHDQQPNRPPRRQIGWCVDPRNRWQTRYRVGSRLHGRDPSSIGRQTDRFVS